MIDARSAIGTCDVLFVTLDTLRYDVAVEALGRGLTPRLGAVLPGGRWERRHTPASFTYAAHHAFFAGFLPTPVTPGPHPRLFASRFEGSETTSDRTWVFDAADLPTGLAQAGYHTACIGGVGFFDGRSALGSVLPGLFTEQHWSVEMGVTSPRSAALQVECARRVVERLPADRRLFLFVNVSALHQPNHIFTEGAAGDDRETQIAALAHVDRYAGELIDLVRGRAPALVVLCSDHGTAYGDDGFVGHRLAHPAVWDVPYAELVAR